MSKRTESHPHGMSLEDVLTGVGETMPAEARESVRARVVAHAASQGRLARAKVVFFRSAAAFTATATLLAGTGYAAASTVPGDFLYPVKRAAEEIHLIFSPNAQQDEALLNMTRERTRELRELIEADAPQGDVDRAAEDFGNFANRAVGSQDTSEAAADVAREIEKDVSAQPKSVQDAVSGKLPQAAPEPTPEPEPEPAPEPPSGMTPSPEPSPQPPSGPGSTSSPSDSSPGSGDVTSPGR